MSKPVFNVLFVCTGNICRSPTAEAVLREHVRKLGLEGRVRIDSAGTHSYHIGHPPDPRAIKHAKDRGYDLSSLRARQLSAEDYDEFDLIVSMDAGHHQIVQNRTPIEESRAASVMFLDFVDYRRGQDVPDPYYGGPEDFEHVLDLVESAMEELVAHIKQKL